MAVLVGWALCQGGGSAAAQATPAADPPAATDAATETGTKTATDASGGTARAAARVAQKQRPKQQQDQEDAAEGTPETPARPAGPPDPSPAPRPAPAEEGNAPADAGKSLPKPAPKSPRRGRITPAEEFADLLQDAILLEVKAQNYERKTLGVQEVERLGGILLKRRQRIDDDVAGFEERLSRVPLDALTMPEPPEGVELTAKEELAISSLSTAYESTRDPRGLQTYIAANQSFLSTSDWGDRDRAVRLRDTILDREADLLQFANEAREILRGGKQPVEVEHMIVRLRRLAPEALSRRSDVSSLILEDAELRKKVVREAMDFLQSPSGSLVPTETSATLVARLPTLQVDLVEASHLSDLRKELTVIEVEMADVEARLADRGVNSLTPEDRQEKTSRLAELTNRQSILQHQWMRTPPAQPQLDELIRAQDDVIRRSMYELGYRGALFAHRYDTQRDKTEQSLQTSYSTWELLEEQASLINEMDEARPDPGPLDGLPPRLDPGYVKAQADLILALRKTRPDLFKRPPPPTKPKNIKVTTTKATGTSPLSAVGASAKKAGKSSGGGGRKRGRKR